MPSMFDPQPGQTEVQEQEQTKLLQGSNSPQESGGPLTGDNLDQFNQHILLGSQAVSRIRTLLQVRTS